MERGSATKDNSEIDYVAILRGVWRRHKTLVAVSFLLIASSGLFLLYLTSTPLYLSKALIAIEPAGLAELPFLKEPPRSDTIATHMVLLKSQSLSEAVLESLPKESYEELLARPQYIDYWVTLRNAVAGWFGNAPIVLSQREQAMDELRMARMEFAASKEAENVFVVTATATKPRVAMDLVHTHIQVLLKRARSVDHDEARRAREFLETQYQQVKDNLARAEESVAKLQQQKGRVRAGGQTEVELVRLAQLESALADTQAGRQIAATRIASLRRSLDLAKPGEAKGKSGQPSKDEDEAAAASLAADSLNPANAYRTAQEQLAKLESKLATLRERYTEDHPQVQNTREQVALQQARVVQMARQLPATSRSKTSNGSTGPVTHSDRLDLLAQLAALERESEALVTKEEALKLQLARIQGSLRNLSQDDVEFGNLRRSVEANRSLLAVLSDRVMAARIREQGDSSMVRVIDPASLPTKTTTSKTRNLALMILGLAGGGAFGLALGIEVLRRPVETETDIVKATGLPILGSVGMMGNPTPANGTRRDGRPILLPVQPAGAHFSQNTPIHVELYRAILANIETERLKTPFRSILVTSPGPSEGKSTTILNLAHAFQDFGRRVLVVEADLRRPSLSAPLALTNQAGIVDFLVGSITLEQACRRLPSGVTVIPGQVARGNPVSLLASARCKELLHVASSQFDLILVDSAPVLAVPDNILFGGLVDRVLLVAKATGTSIRDLRKAQEVVERAGGRLLGVVLNQANPRDMPYYHSRYRKYYALANAKWPESTAAMARGAARRNAPGVAGRQDTREKNA